MKILQVVHGWVPRETGGTEKYVARLAQALGERDIDVSVVCGSPEGHDASSRGRRTWNGITVHEIRRRGLYLDTWYRSWNPDVEDLYLDILDEVRPDVVHVHHWQRLTRNLVELTTEAGIPAVVTLHDTSATCPKTFRIRDGRYCTREVSATNCGDCVERFWFQNDEEIGELVESYRDDMAAELELARRVIVPSQALGDLVVSHVPEVADSIIHLPHGRLSTAGSSDAAHLTERFREDRRLKLAYWGELKPMKGLHILFDALGLIEGSDRLELDVWGAVTDETRDYVEELREKAGDVSVDFRGAFTPEDLPAGEYHVAVFPSICFETHSFTLDEAWRLGLPVVAPDRGAFTERLEEAGALFEPENPADLARVLEEILIKPRRIAEWREEIPEPNTMGAHARHMASLYEEALEAGPATDLLNRRLSAARRRAAVDQLHDRDRELYRLRGRVDQELDRADDVVDKLAESNAALAQKEAILSEFNTNLADLTQTLKKREAEIEELSRIVTAKERDHEARIEEQERQLEDRNRNLDEFAQSSEQLQTVLNATRADVDALRAHEAELEARLAEREAGTADEIDRATALLRSEIARRDEEAAAADWEGRIAAADSAFGRVDRMRANLRVELEAVSAELRDREEALARAILEVERLSREHEHITASIRKRLTPIGEEVAGPAIVAASPGEILSAVVENHVRLHELIRERDELLNTLMLKVDDYERAASGEPDPAEQIEWDNTRTRALRIKGRMNAITRRWRSRGSSGTRRRILFVVHDFLPRHNAGTEIYTYNLAKELAREYDVHLLFCEARHDLPRYTVSHGSYDGLPYTEVVHNYWWRSFEETYHDPEMEQVFGDVLEAFDPDLVHIQHLHYFSFNFIPLAKARGIPVVYTLHEFMILCARGGQLLREDMEICEQPVPEKCADCIRHQRLQGSYGGRPRRGVIERVAGVLPDTLREAFEGFAGPTVPEQLTEADRPIYARAAQARLDFIRERVRDVDLFISPSRFLRQKYIDSGFVREDQILHSDNGFDLSPFVGFKREPSETLRFGFVGTIAEYKGVHVLVQAFNEIDAPDVELQIWGDLETFAEYKEVLVPQITNERIKIKGRFDNDRIADVLSGLDVLIVPSLWFENSPLTIHEAWLAGMPVIASDRGGMAELVDHERNGLLFRLGDADDLREKILQLIENRELVEQYGRESGDVKSIADNAREIVGYYNTLLTRAARA